MKKTARNVISSSVRRLGSFSPRKYTVSNCVVSTRAMRLNRQRIFFTSMRPRFVFARVRFLFMPPSRSARPDWHSGALRSQIVCSFFCYQKYEHDILTRSSAVAKRPRDASFLSVVSFVASILQYLERSFFIISYFSFGFTSGYNSILFCYLRRNVKPCCHTHDLS